MLHQLYKISTLPLSTECALASVLYQCIHTMHYKVLKLDLVLLMLGLLPSIHCIVAHATATDIAMFVLQLPLKLLHHVAHSTAIANYCTATQLLRSKKLK